MQFMLMVYKNEEHFAHIPDADKHRVSEECDAWQQELRRSGHERGMNRLQSANRAATVRKTADRFLVTDGPFAETKEVFAGYILLECRDRAEAVELAKTFPALNIGLSVEVRPVLSGEEERRPWRQT